MEKKISHKYFASLFFILIGALFVLFPASAQAQTCTGNFRCPTLIPPSFCDTSNVTVEGCSGYTTQGQCQGFTCSNGCEVSGGVGCSWNFPSASASPQPSPQPSSSPPSGTCYCGDCGAGTCQVRDISVCNASYGGCDCTNCNNPNPSPSPALGMSISGRTYCTWDNINLSGTPVQVRDSTGTPRGSAVSNGAGTYAITWNVNSGQFAARAGPNPASGNSFYGAVGSEAICSPQHELCTYTGGSSVGGFDFATGQQGAANMAISCGAGGTQATFTWDVVSWNGISPSWYILRVDRLDGESPEWFSTNDIWTYVPQTPGGTPTIGSCVGSRCTVTLSASTTPDFVPGTYVGWSVAPIHPNGADVCRTSRGAFNCFLASPSPSPLPSPSPSGIIRAAAVEVNWPGTNCANYTSNTVGGISPALTATFTSGALTQPIVLPTNGTSIDQVVSAGRTWSASITPPAGFAWQMTCPAPVQYLAYTNPPEIDYYTFLLRPSSLWAQVRGGNVHTNANIDMAVPSSRRFVTKESSLINLKDVGIASYNTTASIGNCFFTGPSDYCFLIDEMGVYSGGNYYIQMLNRFPVKLPLSDDALDDPLPSSGVYIMNPGPPAVYTFTVNGPTEWNVPAGTSIVIFVPRQLTIQKRITVQPGGFLAFIVADTGSYTEEIRIQNIGSAPVTNPNRVTDAHVSGVYITDGRFWTDNQNTQLVLAGTFIARDFILQRDLGQVNNDLYPAEVFIYRPDFWLNAPQEMGDTNIQWEELAP